MKILLDHCIDWRLKRSLPSHEVKSTRDCNWERLSNGNLLAASAARFDVFLTVDRNISKQQNIGKLPIAVLVLLAKSARIEDLQPLMPTVEETLTVIRPGSLIEVRLDGTTVISPGRGE